MFTVCIVDYVELNLLITEVSHLGCQFVVPKGDRFGCREFCLSNSHAIQTDGENLTSRDRLISPVLASPSCVPFLRPSGSKRQSRAGSKNFEAGRPTNI